MTNKLAVTASLKQCSVAVRYDGKVYQKNENADSSIYLVEIIRQTFVQFNLDIKAINEIITTSGPGSFTGIRAAQSCVKGLSFALKIPATCVTYFDVIKNLCDHKENLIAIIKSEKNDFYFHDFKMNLSGVCKEEQLKEMISSNTTFAGEIPQFFVDDHLADCIQIEDFRDAKHLINIESEDTTIKPLYINARSSN